MGQDTSDEGVLIPDETPGLQLLGQVHTVMLPLMSALIGVNTGDPRQSGDKIRDI